MEYILKLRVKKEDLESEIHTGLLEGYQIDTEVTKAPGELQIPGLDTFVLGFNVRDKQTGNCSTYVAIGYEDATEAKYRVFGYLEKYCPKCKIGHSLSNAGKFCKDCGTKLQYRI